MGSVPKFAVVVSFVVGVAAVAGLLLIATMDAPPSPATGVTAGPEAGFEPSTRPSPTPAVHRPVLASPSGPPSGPPGPPVARATLPPSAETRNEAARRGDLRFQAEVSAPRGVVAGVVGGLPSEAPPPPGASVPLHKVAGQLDHEAAIDRSRADFNTEAYEALPDNPFLASAGNPLSTFSIDVDTASYANVRRFLAQGQLPPRDAVRVEELLNYFRYDYPEPEDEAPFSVVTEVAACPWAGDHRLVLVGLRGRTISDAALPPRRLTFLLDVSGSMNMPTKLPLLRQAMALLVESLREEDQVAIVVYAGSSGLVLPPTSGDRKAEIRDALASLEAGGSTAGGAGIELAYRVAAEMFLPGGTNRVVLATDGDFNVGITSMGALARLIEEKRRSGVFLSVLGFGEGNLKDATMEMLADRGNGNYSYIDGLVEARKVLVSEAGGTLVTIAKDVKVQVEMNPRRVAAYRLIGYENRLLRAEDFADDRKDAGEIGAGHTVTALYEIVPPGAALDLRATDPLRYQAAPPLSEASKGDELMTVKLRYKDPDGDTSRLLSQAVRDVAVSASENLRFAAAVAEFGMLLRGSEHRGAASWTQVLELAEGARGRDASGYRGAFLDLARRAEELSSRSQVAITP